jgi:DNA-binding CsgD family transcriptional regulator
LLALVAVRTRRHDLAESYIRRGLDYCIERDLGDTPFTEAWRAALDAQRGRWPQAEDTAELVLSRGGVGLATAVTLTTFARLLVRQGREGRHEALEAARERAERSGELWLLAPIASVLAEAAWLEGRAHDVSGLTQPAWEASSTRGEVWVTAELAAWRKRAGLVDPIDESTPEPYASELAGDALGAAALWDKLGCPYEAALARADSDNEKAQRLALDQLRELGAEPAATIVARRLRSRGAKGLPRGPRPSTRENPAGLTSREVEVLTLVAEGLRNGDIAQRLFLSEKTVSHHVSAILHKLDVKTRGEAGAAAVRLGLARDDA